jgi:hypothetical protein
VVLCRQSRALSLVRGSLNQAYGWNVDPYRLHEDRYFSGGLPTKLVRDAGRESYDEPPDSSAAVQPGGPAKTQPPLVVVPTPREEPWTVTEARTKRRNSWRVQWIG